MALGKWLVGLAFMGVVVPLIAQAQPQPSRLVREAQFGSIHEVLGDEIAIAAPRTGCPAKFQPLADGPCFDKVTLKPASLGPTRVLTVLKPGMGDWVSGVYGRDFRLYDLFPVAEGIHAEALAFETSGVAVPRDCFSLASEPVGYAIEHRKTGDVAVEHQTVVCGGGPRQPTGPYTPEGPPLTPGNNGLWHVTETQRVEGAMRYLATPGACEPQYSVKTTWCAQPAITWMQANPDEKELDLVAARHDVRAGDVLTKAETDQWVLKRKGSNKYKVDSRWVDKSYMTAVDGCTPVEDIGWWVTGRPDGLYITEKALNRCGAPPAPVPAEIWEAYGDDYFIVDCAREGRGDWRKGRPRGKDAQGKAQGDQAAECFDAAGDYLRRIRRTNAVVVVLNDRARPDDHLYPGGYVSYDVAEVMLNKDNSLSARRLDSFDPSGIYMNRCTQVTDGPPDSRGFVIVRSMGIGWARAYRWMNCPVY
ncbi:MAG: hypothetical protein QM647_11960 [Asticcacaulis sp.]|uniref:hypothetical protein n=1 Tax=Asticcacaulis sp. TaxID=1872648 RepID=UPI0039E3542D